LDVRHAAIIWLFLLAQALAESPTRGSLLVASPSSTDPDLARAVVLLLRTDSQGAVGLIVNQPSPVPVSTIFPKAKAMMIFKGGPLRMGINALIRQKGPGRSLVFGDVYLVSEKAEIESLVSSGLPLRVYVGLCGWTTGQLAAEIERGVWSVHQASADIVLAGQPQSVWLKLGSNADRVP
jgi:putative transcriptional regulator